MGKLGIKLLTSVVAVMSGVAGATAGDMLPVVVSTPDVALGEQVLVTANRGIRFPQEKVSQRWEDDYYITSLSYNSAGWAIVMSHTNQWDDQTYKLSENWPNDWIQDRYKDGYFITSVAADGHNWAVALTRGTGITEQFAVTQPWNELLEYIVDLSQDGWMVTALAYNDGLWTAVMSKGTTFTRQKCEFATSSLDITEAVNRARTEGMILTSIAADNSRYVLIFSRMNNGDMPEQNVTQALESPRQLFKTEELNGMKVLFIGG